MKLVNARYFDGDFALKEGQIQVEDDTIVSLEPSDTRDPQTYDVQGCFVLPGLIDIHIHGCGGAGISDASSASVGKMARFLAKEGVTSFLPTTITQPPEALAAQVEAIRSAERTGGAHILGIHLEGPFFSPEKSGIQPKEHLLSPDFALVEDLDHRSGGLIKLVDVAPELPGGMEFIARAKDRFLVGLAHSDTDYDTAVRAMEMGAHHVTHLFNAMSGFSHRQPGLVGAVFDSKVAPTAELIADGHHLHPAVIRTAFRLLGEDRVILVSDGLAPAGLPDGDYTLGPIPIRVEKGLCRGEDGTIAGSALTLMDMLRRTTRFGIPFNVALRAATLNPAKLLGEDKRIGSIQVGKQADLVVVDPALRVQRVFLKGRPFNRALAGT